MKDLIARLEAATEGSLVGQELWKISAGIHAVAIGGEVYHNGAMSNPWGVKLPDGGIICGYEIPQYTISLDAALTLVPKGYGWQIHFWANAKKAQGWVQKQSHDGFNSEVTTPALALCIAALKARVAA